MGPRNHICRSGGASGAWGWATGPKECYRTGLKPLPQRSRLGPTTRRAPSSIGPPRQALNPRILGGIHGRDSRASACRTFNLTVPLGPAIQSPDPPHTLTLNPSPPPHTHAPVEVVVALRLLHLQVDPVHLTLDGLEVGGMGGGGFSRGEGGGERIGVTSGVRHHGARGNTQARHGLLTLPGSEHIRPRLDTHPATRTTAHLQLGHLLLLRPPLGGHLCLLLLELDQLAVQALKPGGGRSSGWFVVFGGW